MVFWENRKVLITGHTGFVGAWMATVLKYFGADVSGIALSAEANSLYSHLQDDLSVDEYQQDLRKAQETKENIQKIQPEIIIHLAAYGFVRECYENPEIAYSTNIMGTVNLLEAACECKSVKNILVVSSDKVYKNEFKERTQLFDENNELGGIDSYSCSKACEDMITQSYFDTYLKEKGIVCSIARPGNILGGGDHIKSRLLPMLLEKCSNAEPIEIRHSDAVRPWQHILDAIDAYLTIIEKHNEDKNNNINIYNVGPNLKNQMTVGEIANYIQRKFCDVQIAGTEAVPEAKVRESKFLGLNIHKIEKQLDWEPKKNIYEVLDDVHFFWKRSKNESYFDLCMEQIKEYYSI